MKYLLTFALSDMVLHFATLNAAVMDKKKGLCDFEKVKANPVTVSFVKF